MKQRDANDFKWSKESGVSVTVEGLTLENIGDTILEFGRFQIMMMWQRSNGRKK